MFFVLLIEVCKLMSVILKWICLETNIHFLSFFKRVTDVLRKKLWPVFWYAKMNVCLESLNRFSAIWQDSVYIHCYRTDTCRVLIGGWRSYSIDITHLSFVQKSLSQLLTSHEAFLFCLAKKSFYSELGSLFGSQVVVAVVTDHNDARSLTNPWYLLIMSAKLRFNAL